MSGRRGGRAKGGRTKGQQPATTSTQQPKPTIELENKLQHLIKDLLLSAFQDLPKEDRPDEETTFKCIKEIENHSKALLKEEKIKLEYQKYAIKFTLTIQMVGKLNGLLARQVVAVIFTYYLDELTKHWMEYDIKKEEIHTDYCKSLDFVDPLIFKVEGTSDVEYDSWTKAWNYLKQTK
eukprot:TRINITY_DN1383_c0_g1_i1.p1 TRINITY_DN1383_c0_g1~~TRINITY_DN1383_c0_g1_i1.p1  ORF type:complete len:191 (+),score=48.77 TRINITY_DN1383_c0_g1_i1:38-574(+)